MKKVIKNKLYNTDTAKVIGKYEENGDFTTLYRKVKGEFFLYIESTEEIHPLTYDEADQWVEAHLPGDMYKKLFGTINECNEPARISVYLSVQELDMLRRNACKAGMSVSEYIVMRCTE